MTPSPRPAPAPPVPVASGIDEAAPDQMAIGPGFDRLQWQESEAESDSRGAGGRAVLASALTILAILWTAYTAWSAGRTLSDQPLTSPAVAQWIAIAAGPLALLGLVWLMFGRTRRKEAERFTRSVIAMRTEARSLEGLLAVLRTRLDESQSALVGMTQRLLELGDSTSNRLGEITAGLDNSGETLAGHAAALDRAAEAARNDIAVLLDDVPQAEVAVRRLSTELRSTGTDAATRASELEQRLVSLAETSRTADESVGSAAQRLIAHLTQIESAGAAAAARVSEAEAGFSGALDAMLEQAARSLDEIRAGIDAQSQAVSALVDQSRAGLGRAGADAAEALSGNLANANASLDSLSSKVAEQERASQRLVADIDQALAALDQKFAEVTQSGDERSARFLSALARARSELEALAENAASQDGSIGGLADRTDALRQQIEELNREIRDGLAPGLSDAEAGAERLRTATVAVRPEIDWVRDAAIEAGDRLAASASSIASQQDSLTSLLAMVDEGVGSSEARIAELARTIAGARDEATSLSSETGPALVSALVQVKEAAAHAAERAREAISAVIPECSENLSAATRSALERAVEEGVSAKLQEVEAFAAQAIEAARAASDRLTQQMLTLGQTARALEQHIEQTGTEQRERDSEAFARRVSLLMDSMNSASIDVGKILSDEIDDKAWDSYLKGNRGVFTRRAVRLLDGSQARAIQAHYESEAEFQRSVNRYVHDFEAMLRRVLAERDGGMIAVTLMSSDMGKLYAALAQAIDRRR